MKMKICKSMLITGISGLMYVAAASTAVAATGMKHGVADLNSDGMVTADELVTYVEMNFLKMDKNNDHMLDNGEWDDFWWSGEDH